MRFCVLSTKSIQNGPKLPVPLKFPCTINIDDDQIFIFGEQIMAISVTMPSLTAYLFNMQTGLWSNFTNFPCQTFAIKTQKFTCAFLKPMKSVIVPVENCTAILNLSDGTWTSIEQPGQGIVFNIDEEKDRIMFIGNNGKDESDLYLVGDKMYIGILF